MLTGNSHVYYQKPENWKRQPKDMEGCDTSKFTVYLPASVRDTLQHMANEQGICLSELVRRILRKVVEEL